MHLPRWSFSSSPSPSPSPSPSTSTSTSASPSPNNSTRRLTRAKQIRHLRDCDFKTLDIFLNSPPRHRHRHGNVDKDNDFLRSSSSPSPHPLPLPETAWLKSKKRGGSESFRLPSPVEVFNSFDLNNNNNNNNNNNLNPSRVAPQDGRRSVDSQKRVNSQQGVDGQRLADPHSSIQRSETWSSWGVPPQNIPGSQSRRGQGNLTVDVTFWSAPPSSSPSPMQSPERMFYGDPFFMYPMDSKRWSEPAVTSGFQFGGAPESTMVSRDTSPFRSPLRKIPTPSRKSISGPASPMHPRLSAEIASPHHDINFVGNVHPLPLPPTPSSTSVPPSPVPQVSPRTEFLSMKNQWTKGKLIGRGTFGSVFVATHRETGALCAMKEVDLLPEDPKCAECMKQLEQEIRVLSHLKHPNIVQYYGSEIIKDKFYIYLEYVYPGSIHKYIHEHSGSITEAVVRNFSRHILSGLAYLHSRKTIHRDIKGANLLVDACGVVKLADFGMAKHLTEHAAALSLKGSPYWMAPELMQAVMQKENSSDLALAVDIWSLGCTIIEMLTGKPPWSEFEGAAAMFKVLKESPPIPETLSSEGKDFLRCCFQRDPADRPPASKLLEHPFLRTSQQLDFPSSSSVAPNPMNQMDGLGEMHDHKHEKVPLSPNRTGNGRSYCNESARISHLETSGVNVSFHRSPRSILEPATCTSLRSASNQNIWCMQMS